MRIVESTGKYAAVVIGVLNNLGRDNASRARMLIDNDIKNLESALGIARTARQMVLEVEHKGCDLPFGGPCTCNESTSGTITQQEGATDGLTQASS